MLAQPTMRPCRHSIPHIGGTNDTVPNDGADTADDRPDTEPDGRCGWKSVPDPGTAGIGGGTVRDRP